MTRGVDEGDATLFVVHLGGDLVGTDVLGDATGLARDDVRLADGIEEAGLTVVDVTHDGDDRRTRHEVFLAALVLAELDVEALEELAVLFLRADDLNRVVHLVGQHFQRLVGDGLGGRDHFAEVHHHGDERRRVGVDLLREVGEGRTARQANGLAVAAGQHHAADGRGLHGLVLLAPLTLGLAATTGRTAGTAEGTLRATTGTGTTGTPAEAGTTAATGTGRTAAEAAATRTRAAEAAAARTRARTGRTTGEAAARGTTGATGTRTARTGTTATGAATGTGTGTTGSGTLRHHARVGTVTTGSTAGTRGAALRTRHAARGRTTGTGTLRTRSATGTTLRAGSTLAATGAGGTGTGSAGRTGRLRARHAGGATRGERVVARTGTRRTGALRTRGLATGSRGLGAGALPAGRGAPGRAPAWPP